MPSNALWSLEAEGNTRNAQEKNDWVTANCGGLVRNVPSGATSTPDHNNLRCSDFMITTNARGDKLRAFVIQHHKKLGVNLIIWDRAITRFYDKPGIPAGRSVPYYGGNPHTDHNHVEFNEKRMSGADIPDNTVPDWDGKSYPGSDAFHIGKRHEAVKVLGQRLIIHAFVEFHDGDGYQAGTEWTIYDVKNVQKVQEMLGFKGNKRGQDADGYPGKQTWDYLMGPPKKVGPAVPKSRGWYHIGSTLGTVNAYDKKGKKLARTVKHPYNVWVDHFFAAGNQILGQSTKYAYRIEDLDLGQVVTVKKGESLSSIAKAHETTVAAIVKTNRIANPDVINAGQRLIIK